MTEVMVRKRNVVSEELRAAGKKRSLRHRPALAVVLALSAFLNLYHLTDEGYGIPYYAAAVKNMLTSWHNFFFVSFDAGFVSVDKPPLGLWIQAASAKLFGFHSLSLLLPQAIAGVLCVAVLYHLVRRSFGPVAGLLAALVLAVTPISVATSRSNTMDMLLVLTVLLAVWTFLHATETGRLRWLLLGAVVMGLGFNIKMLEAFLVLPAFYLLYLVAAPATWRRRFVHLGVATLVLLVVSLSWAVVVDLTPADQRPYVGSSSNDTVTNLILGYNGLDRLWGTTFRGGEAISAGALGGPSLGVSQNGEPGPFRLLNHQYAGQIGWLLPIAVVGLLAASRQRPLRLPLDRKQQALVLWGTWFFTTAPYFSVAGGQHRYYTVMLAPAIAALVGAGVVALWSDYRSPGRSEWLLPLALVGTAALQVHILSGYEGWSMRLTPVIIGLCFIAAVVLVVLPHDSKPKTGAYAAVATAAGVMALLIAPTVWASYQVFEGPRGTMPLAGPLTAQVSADGFGGVNTQGSLGGGNIPSVNQSPFGIVQPSGPPDGRSPSGASMSVASRSTADPALVDFLLANQGNAKYLVASNSASSTAPIILSTDEPVISLGGFNGLDPVFTNKQIADLVNEGTVRFFLVPDKQHMSCEQVPRQLWNSAAREQVENPSVQNRVLYDCGAGSR
jgi:4-amino-4-deoxy-L-arabinose transferase-like glycosyltransferase